jgi:hypothetical protein
LYLVDALHPQGEGYAAEMREVGILLGSYSNTNFPFINAPTPFVSPFPKMAGYQASSVSTTLDYLTCPRVLEDPTKYNLIADGFWVAGAPGSYMDFGSGTSAQAITYLGVPATTDIFMQYGVSGSIGTQGDNVDNGNAAFLHSGMTKSAQGGAIRFQGFSAGYPRLQYTYQNVRIYRPRPAAQKNPLDPNIAIAIASTALTGVSVSQTVQRAGVIGVMSCIAATAVTSGTVTVAVNGTTIATMTFTSSVTAVGSGTFFTAATAGIFLNEGDVITCAFTLVGGSLPVVRLSNS